MLPVRSVSLDLEPHIKEADTVCRINLHCLNPYGIYGHTLREDPDRITLRLEPAFYCPAHGLSPSGSANDAVEHTFMNLNLNVVVDVV